MSMKGKICRREIWKLETWKKQMKKWSVVRVVINSSDAPFLRYSELLV